MQTHPLTSRPSEKYQAPRGEWKQSAVRAVFIAVRGAMIKSLVFFMRTALGVGT
jgi:hypothetical protein